MTYADIFSSTGKKKKKIHFERLCTKGQDPKVEDIFTKQICEYRQIAGNKEVRSEGVAK